MQDLSYLTALLGAFLPQIPLFLAYLAGAAIALVRWPKHPRVSLYLLVSVLLSIIVQIVVTGIQVWLPALMMSRHLDAVTMGYYFAALGVVSNLLHTLAFCLLLAAILTDRKQPPGRQ